MGEIRCLCLVRVLGVVSHLRRISYITLIILCESTRLDNLRDVCMNSLLIEIAVEEGLPDERSR